MVLPIIILVTIPVFLGIAYVSPFDLPDEAETEMIPEESDVGILYFLLMGIWTIFLIRILLQVRKGIFKITQRY